MQLIVSSELLPLQDDDVVALEMLTAALPEMHLQTGKENAVNGMTSGFSFSAD